MDKLIFKKIKDKKGASIVFGLIAILVAVVVAVLILTASVTAARRTRSDMKTTQSMLTLDSAAELIMNELENMSVKVHVTQTKDQGIISGMTYVVAPDGITVSGRESFLASEITKAFEGISFANSFPPQDYTSSFEIQSEKMDKVTAVFVMKHGNHEEQEETEDYEILVSLTDGNANLYITANVTSISQPSGDVTMSWNPSVTNTGM